jgi:nitrite reductase (NO-forming)
VRAAQAQAQRSLRLSLAFVVAAVLACGLAAVSSEVGRWLPLHLFLAGGVVLAISGASLMLTVTWSAAPAPSDAWATVQRISVAVGAAGVAAARQAELSSSVVGTFGALFLFGLVLLAVLLVVTVRQGVERRYDVAVAAYVLALVAGVAGVSVGVAIATGHGGPGWRGAHLTLNLLGLVGLVIAGTLPFFAATAGRARMAPWARPRRLALATGWLAAALLLTAVAAAERAGVATAVGLVAYAAGLVAVLTTLPRPTRRQAEWAGPRLAALWAGTGWWIVGVVAAALHVHDAPTALFTDRWLLVVVVAGYGQILWGALAYLLPVLRAGGHEQLSAGFAATRSWLGFAALNVVGLALAVDLRPLAALAGAVLVADGALRTLRLRGKRDGSLAT